MGKFYEELRGQLELYVRQLAHLHTAPKHKRSKPQSDQEPETRMQQLHRQGIQPPLPDPGAARYILEHLFEIGPVVPAGMSSAAIGYQDLLAYQRCTGACMSPWESETVRFLSRAWLDQQAKSERPNCNPPWVEPKLEDRAARLDGQMRAIFGISPRGQ